MAEKKKKPSAAALMGMLKFCRQDLADKDQKIQNIVQEITELATENEALRRRLIEAGLDVPEVPNPPPPLDLMHLLHRRDDARYALGMGRSLDDDQIRHLVDDLDIVIAALLERLR